MAMRKLVIKLPLFSQSSYIYHLLYSMRSMKQAKAKIFI
jgi:hypothetical protein